MIFTIVKVLCLTSLASLFVAICAAWYLYSERTEGTIYLKNAPGVVSISRESDSGIAHIEGENLLAVLYG